MNTKFTSQNHWKQSAIWYNTDTNTNTFDSAIPKEGELTTAHIKLHSWQRRSRLRRSRSRLKYDRLDGRVGWRTDALGKSQLDGRSEIGQVKNRQGAVLAVKEWLKLELVSWNSNLVVILNLGTRSTLTPACFSTQLMLLITQLLQDRKVNEMTTINV